MNGKELSLLYGGLAVVSTVCTPVVSAQFNRPRDVPAFSYDVEFFEYDEKGAKKYTHTDHYAVRSDGSTAIVDDSLLASTGEHRLIVSDYTRREVWITSLLGRTVTTLPMAPGAVSPVGYGQCDEGDVGTVGRYEVRKDRRIVRNQDTDEVLWTLDRWRAPELGCVVLRTVRYNKDEKLTHDRVATNILLGEPDPAWFHVPEGYVESSPKQAQQKLVDLGIATPFRDELGIIERAEDRYWNTR
jgi:hypothetical protein